MMAAEHHVFGPHMCVGSDLEYAQIKPSAQYASSSILHGSLHEVKDVAQTSRCGCIVADVRDQETGNLGRDPEHRHVSMLTSGIF